MKRIISKLLPLAIVLALVFTGFVDELELSMTSEGTALQVHGRGCGARLLDNQVEGKTFYLVTTQKLLESYVTPLQIQAIDPPTRQLMSYQIGCGSTVMQVLEGFCRHAGLCPPMFDAYGRLLLREAYPKSSLCFEQAQLFEATYRDKRYGVRSKVQLTNTKTGKIRSASYAAFIARGGLRAQYGQYSGGLSSASGYTATQLLRRARREEYTVELATAQQFPCEPGTSVQVKLPAFGVDGRYLVSALRSVGSAQGCWATVSLRKE